MPVQINELIIKAVVDPAPSGSGTQTTASSHDNHPAADREVVEKVFEILKEKQER